MKDHSHHGDYQYHYCRKYKWLGREPGIIWKYLLATYPCKITGNGNAIKHDNPTSRTKFFVIKGTNCPVFAPMTFRMLISFCLCCVVNAISHSSPRQVISIVDIEKAVKILPRFWSAAYCELKSSSKNLYSNGNCGKNFFQVASTFEMDDLILPAFILSCIILQLGE